MMCVLAASSLRLAGALGGHHRIHYGGSPDFFFIKCVWKLRGCKLRSSAAVYLPPLQSPSLS